MGLVISQEIILNSALLLLCYLYIIGVIFISIKLSNVLPKSLKRKFLHILIGTLVYIIPFFTFTSFPLNFPFFVAAPFVLLTLSAMPSSPLVLKEKVEGLAKITNRGHGSGLFLYAISYTVLALFCSSKPYILIAGVLPMAFGDAAASIVGQKMGLHKFTPQARKSFEGSAAMFSVTFVSVACSLLLFSYLCPFSTLTLLLSSLGVAISATILEALTPKGLDNLTVPLVSAAIFLFLTGGA